MRKVALLLRPTVAILIAFACFAGLRYRSWRNDEGGDFIRSGDVTPERLPELGAGQLLLPNRDLSPAAVVRAQLEGLADAKADGLGILQCYCFASPGNRAVTGPLERFGRMVRQGQFACLGQPRATLVGDPQLDGRLAKLLVTVVDQHEQVHIFTFILFKQLDPPFKDCWMTEGVYPFGQLGKPADRSEPEPPLA